MTHSDNSKLKAAYGEVLARFGNRKNVTAVDIGYKYINGNPTGETCIRVHVKEKFPEHSLEAIEIFPNQILGIPIDVIQANYESNNRITATEESKIQRTIRTSLLQPGISISHSDGSAGTLGAIVLDKYTNTKCILSNWHVLAGENAKPGDSIVQPGSYDGGRTSRDTIASLERMMLDFDGDAAIGIINDKL